MRQLRVENTLYNLPDEVWRQVNDLLAKAEGTKRLTQEMLKDEIPLDQTEESGGAPAEGTGPDGSADDGGVPEKPLGEELSEEEQP